MREELTQSRAKELFLYDHRTGIVVRRVSVNKSNAQKGQEVGVKKNGYFVVHIDDTQYKLHRVIWLYAYGEWPNHIDHIDGDRANNRLDNLRSVTQSENNRNSSRPSTNTSGLSGVSWNKGAKKYEAYIHSAGKRQRLGFYTSLFDAAAARLSEKNRLGYHSGHGKVAYG